jgi:hypothetical protein
MKRNTDRLAPLPPKSLSVARISLASQSKDSIGDSTKKYTYISRDVSQDAIDYKQRRMLREAMRRQEKEKKIPLPAKIDPDVYNRLTKRKSLTQDIIDETVQRNEIFKQYWQEQDANTRKKKFAPFTFSQDKRQDEESVWNRK